MANKIRIKRSGVAGKVPSTSDLDLGELGINYYDGKLYLKKDNGTQSIVEVGVNPGVTQPANGGTGQTSYVKGDALVGTDDGSLERTSNSTGAIILPVGTTAQRPSSPVVGMFRFNSELATFEGYNGVQWTTLSAPETTFNFEGDLNTLTGVEDLQSGTGSIDLMGEVTSIEGDLNSLTGTEDLQSGFGTVDLRGEVSLVQGDLTAQSGIEDLNSSFGVLDLLN